MSKQTYKCTKCGLESSDEGSVITCNGGAHDWQSIAEPDRYESDDEPTYKCSRCGAISDDSMINVPRNCPNHNEGYHDWDQLDENGEIIMTTASYEAWKASPRTCTKCKAVYVESEHFNTWCKGKINHVHDWQPIEDERAERIAEYHRRLTMPTNQTIEINSAAHLAGLRKCCDLCEDRELAAQMYREIMKMAKDLAVKFEFKGKEK